MARHGQSDIRHGQSSIYRTRPPLPTHSLRSLLAEGGSALPHQLKDRLAATENEEADVLRDEIEDLEDRIDELTIFRTGSEVQ